MAWPGAARLCASAAFRKVGHPGNPSKQEDPEERTMNMHIKHAPRRTNYGLNPGDELNDLRMSDEVRPLHDHVRKFIRETVDPMASEFVRLGRARKDRWRFGPAQREALQSAKAQSKPKG